MSVGISKEKDGEDFQQTKKIILSAILIAVVILSMVGSALYIHTFVPESGKPEAFKIVNTVLLVLMASGVAALMRFFPKNQATDKMSEAVWPLPERQMRIGVILISSSLSLAITILFTAVIYNLFPIIGAQNGVLVAVSFWVLWEVFIMRKFVIDYVMKKNSKKIIQNEEVK